MLVNPLIIGMLGMGTKNGVTILMHLTLGQTSDWNPCLHIRMRHAIGACTAY